jgi:hypothetical protein
MDRHVGASRYFSHVITADSLSEEGLRDALTLRLKTSGVQVKYCGSEGEVEQQKTADGNVQNEKEGGFYRAVSANSGRNLYAALYFLLPCCRYDSGTQSFFLYPPDALDMAFIKEIDRLHLLTLAELAGHGVLTLQEHGRIFRTDPLRSRIVFEYLEKNVLAGITILLDRPFRVGDMVKVDTYYGEVTQIGLRTIRLHTFEDSTITLPNGLFFSKAVSNSGALVEQVVVEFSLPANVPIQEVKELMHEAALCSPYVYRNNPVEVLVEDRFDRAFLSLFKVKAYVMDVRFERLMASDITERVKEAIQERGLFAR